MTRRAILRPAVAAALPLLVAAAAACGLPSRTAAGRGPTAGLTEQRMVAIRMVPTATQSWPHEPAGYAAVSDQPWSGLWSEGWTMQFGEATITRDATAPRSPPKVLTIEYPRGFAGGAAPATATRAFPAARGVFTSFWWKPSDPWQGHESNVNKLLFLFPEEGGDMALVMYGPPGGPYELRVIPQFLGLPSEWLLPNATRLPVALGAWHRVEWLVDVPAGAALGTVQWWLDGELIGDHRDVPFPPDGMIELKISPTWGGVGDQKREVDRFWFDHVYLSRRD